MPPPASRPIIEAMLQTRSVNLVGGAVGVGKTTFLLQLTDAVGCGGKFFQFTTYPTKVAYVMIDRSRAETLETLARLQLDPSGLTLFPIDELSAFPTMRDLIDKLCPAFGLVIVEPLDYLLRDEHGRAGNPNDKMQVFQFLLGIRRALAPHDCCFVGSMHTTKAGKDRGYLIARERIAGSTAWTANTSTSILVESVDPRDVTSPRRTITIMPRNRPNLVIDAYADDETGRLVEVGVADGYVATHQEIQKAPPGTVWDVGWMQAQAKLAGVHPRSMRRFLDSRIGAGELVDGGRGIWRKPR